MSDKMLHENETVSIQLKAAADRPDILSIREAMAQIEDFFDLLTPIDKTEGDFYWGLKAATSNSPLMVTGEPVSCVRNVSVAIPARRKIKTFRDNMSAFVRGESPPHGLAASEKDKYQKFLRRNTEGIGTTLVNTGGGESPIAITPISAQQGLRVIEGPSQHVAPEERPLSHKSSVGAIDGYLMQVTSYRNKPAIIVRDRITNTNVWCLLTPGLENEISKSVDFRDLWQHKRVRVTGRKIFKNNGFLNYLDAESIVVIAPRNMTLNDIYDPDFTGGLSALDYLNQLREG